MANDGREIIFKVKKIQAPAHGGGAWKVAYADFVTAMMAFFLLLWLLNSSEQEVLEGLSNYFTPTLETKPGSSGAGGMFGGITANDPGPTEETTHSSALDAETSSKSELKSPKNGQGRKDEESTGADGAIDADIEEDQFNSTKKLLETALEQLPSELADLKNAIKIDITKDGLRIRLIDQRKKASFYNGNSKLTKHGTQALLLISQFIERLPNEIAITGHTSTGRSEEGGWQLSIERSNAVRRRIVKNGISIQRIKTVGGKADRNLLNPEAPNAAENRRMTLVLLRRGTKSEKDKILRPPSILRQ
jgi:chemotaxis protein MotB